MSRCFDCLAEKKVVPATGEEFCSCERTSIRWNGSGLAVNRPSMNSVIVGSAPEFVSIHAAAQAIKDAGSVIQYRGPIPPSHSIAGWTVPLTQLPPKPPEPFPEPAKLVAVDRITGQIYRNLQHRHDGVIGMYEGEEYFLPEGSYDPDFE
jgi:hypothetical protein